MQRNKAPRHKLLNEALRQSKSGRHEAKAGKQQSRARSKEEYKQLVNTELFES